VIFIEQNFGPPMEQKCFTSAALRRFAMPGSPRDWRLQSQRELSIIHNQLEIATLPDGARRFRRPRGIISSHYAWFNRRSVKWLIQ
jgi:hypothetical protein